MFAWMHKIPNYKHQIPNKSQIPMIKITNEKILFPVKEPEKSLEFEIWDFIIFF
jgi:hypothetical protein